MTQVFTDKSALAAYRSRVMGCWLGKAIGGTLGQPWEGITGPHNLSYYDPVPDSLIPNDDLDMQVVWACCLSEMNEPVVSRHILAQAMKRCVRFPWDETGIALRNLAEGLAAPLSGSHDNWFVNGMGAAIRSEIWACLAPGNPDLAARYAYEDACIDHDGEGIWAEVFLATLESLAFVESDPDLMLDTALGYLPEESTVRRAISDVRVWCRKERDWSAVRQQILNKYEHENFTDVTMNLAFIVLGWLAGEGDFGASICIAVNCGKDSDCSGASLGALLGILNPDGIAEMWSKPIGRKLLLHPAICNLDPPATLDDLTDMVISLRQRLDETKSTDAMSSQGAPTPAGIVAERTFIPFHHIDLAGITSPISPSIPVLPDRFEQIILPGYMGTLDADDFEDEVMLLRYRFTLTEDRTVRVMFNTPQNCRVWVNGDYAFGRECGRMCPSFHRLPINQCVDLALTKGEHEILAAVGKPNRGKALWVIGVGDPVTHLWIPNLFARD